MSRQPARRTCCFPFFNIRLGRCGFEARAHKQSRELFARVEHSAFHRSKQNTDHLAYFGDGFLAIVGQVDDFPMIRRQFIDAYPRDLTRHHRLQERRAKDVVARTRAFVTNAPISMAPFDVVAAAREANLLVERELRNCGAAVHLQAEPGLPAVKGDVIQIQQVFTNLLLNAAQAMAGKAGAKEITVSFKVNGHGIRLEIADTGPGIDRKQLERVFDPFYTTKPDGIGMGLAICRNCIDAQGGNIWATSVPNHGATIHFTLPVHDG
jgi:signal transduction histidine kinase